VDQLLPLLWKDCGKKPERFDPAIDLLSRLIKNIIDNPSDEKFRVFKRVFFTIIFFFRITQRLKKN